MGVLSEQQAASQQQQLTTKILGDVKHSYLNNMDSLASAIGQEVQEANIFPLEFADQSCCGELAASTASFRPTCS